MSQTVLPGALDPAPVEFGFDLAMLASMGVRPEPEQLRLLDRRTDLAMVAYPLVDPSSRDFDNLEVLRPDGTVSTVVIPAVGLVDWGDVELLDDDDLLFPSVPTAILEPNGRDLSGVVAVRLWNAWPLEQCHLEEVRAAGTRVWGHADYEALALLHYAWSTGDLCHLVGKPREEHQHDLADRVCLDGDLAFDDMLDALYGWHGRRHLPLAFDDEVLMLPPVRQDWERLVASSKRNTFRSLSVVPEHERPGLLRVERAYSPWSLSS